MNQDDLNFIADVESILAFGDLLDEITEDFGGYERSVTVYIFKD